MQRLKLILELQRPVLWLKNLLVFFPVIFVGVSPKELFTMSFCFLLFTVAAGCIYMINDIKDVNEDRAHPKKSGRPLASNRIDESIVVKAILVQLFFLGMAACIFPQLGLAVCVYVLMSIAYAFKIRSVFMADIICVVFLHFMRIYAGFLCLESAIVILDNVQPILLLLLAIYGVTAAKRYSDFSVIKLKSERPYKEMHQRFLRLSIAMSIACYLAVMSQWVLSPHTDIELFSLTSVFSGLAYIFLYPDQGSSSSNYFYSMVTNIRLIVFIVFLNLVYSIII